MFTASTGYYRQVCFSRVLFADLVNPQLLKWHQWRASGNLIWLPLLVHICLGFVVEYWPIVDTYMYRRHSNSELYYFFFVLAFPTSTPPRAPLAHHLIHTGPILMNCMKNLSKIGKNQPLSTCRVSCTKANSYIIMLSERV